MREIKIRAWEKEKQRMSYSKDWDSLNFRIDGTPFRFMMRDEYILIDYRVEVMQFRNLHDRIRQDIYDADVILWPDGYKQVIGFNEKHTETSVRDVETSFGYHFDSLHLVEQGKVIGNIYENPELLKG